MNHLPRVPRIVKRSDTVWGVSIEEFNSALHRAYLVGTFWPDHPERGILFAVFSEPSPTTIQHCFQFVARVIEKPTYDEASRALSEVIDSDWRFILSTPPGERRAWKLATHEQQREAMEKTFGKHMERL